MRKSETTALHRSLNDRLVETITQLAPMLSSSNLIDALDKRLGAFLRVCGAKLQILSGRFTHLDDFTFAADEIRLPLACADEECTLKLTFTMPRISGRAREEILSSMITVADDLRLILGNGKVDDDLRATAHLARSTVIHLSESNLEVTGCPDTTARSLGIRPGLLLFEDITPDEAREHVEALLRSAASGKARHKVTLRRGASRKLDAEIELIERKDGELICEISETAPGGNNRHEYVPPQMPERLVHRLRNPLTTIMSCCSQLLDSEECKLESADRTLVKWIGGAADAQNVTINRYLQLYGSIQLSPRKLSFRQLLVATLAENESRYGGRIQVDAPVEDTLVYSDVYLLKQTLVELLDNAIEASKVGKVELKWRRHNERLLVTLRNPVNEPHLPDRHSAEPFHTTKSGHTGLGLPLAMRCASQLGGSVRLRSENGFAVTEIDLQPLENEETNTKIERE